MTDRRKVLEGIINSPDPNVSARDRLDALAKLDASHPPPPPNPVHMLLQEMTEDVLDRELDQLMATEIVAAVETGDDGSWPVLAGLLRALVEKRAGELADANRIEAEVERRAEERAAQLYLDEGWRSLRQTLDSAAETTADDSGGTGADDEQHNPAPAPRKPLKPPPGIDPSAGWNRPRRGIRR